MDAQYPFASRDDIWRVLDELKELHEAQYEQAERIARLERRRDEDARMKSVWGPLSPFPSSVAGPIPTEPAFHSPPDAFKGFDQGQHGMGSSAVGLDGDDEPRRGASRANSVRFDESAIHGYYGQANRSSTELPLRTELIGTLSSLGTYQQSGTGDDQQNDGVILQQLATDPPPPGLFLLGPAPCIIRCWLTTTFSNDSLLYAAVCSGSYGSSLGTAMIRKFGLEDLVMHEGDQPFIKLPLYLPEASVHQSSSRPGSPTPQLPSLNIRFSVSETEASDDCIQIILGSDVLRSHNADILFSQDKIVMVDEDHNRISIPIVRPEKDSMFKSLATVRLQAGPHASNERSSNQVIDKPTTTFPKQSTSAPASARVSVSEADEARRPRLPDPEPVETPPTSATSTESASTVPPTKQENAGAGIWGSWRRDSKLDPNAAAAAAGKASRGRTMKVLRPSKPPNRPSSSSTSTPTSATIDHAEGSVDHLPTDSTRPAPQAGDENRSSKSFATNPVGGASAFGWLNSGHAADRTANAKS
ncbi:hypothetical protein N7510_008317 [Penicillium lagena]|uniref:uncharacterized protein n=1 Tax=Penicillium lagena TaxID=94218 RepID=UPI002541BEC6|nr:uncharacterized protein N7510_008317 [Penicillium lagena]KAJ5605536.1 hypothetical protein N7510_008317 [Penicillium lagena]